MNLSDVLAKFRNVKVFITDNVPVGLERLAYILGEAKAAVEDAAKFVKSYGDEPVVAEEETPKKKGVAHTKKAAVTNESMQELRDLCDEFRNDASRNPGALAVQKRQRLAAKSLDSMDSHLEVALSKVLSNSLKMVLDRLENR
jgi:hypothetical protein